MATKNLFAGITTLLIFSLFLGKLKDFFRVTGVYLCGFAIGYFVIVLVFAGFYATCFRIWGSPAFQGIDQFDFFSFFCFSLVTATTLGYGDITPHLIITRFLFMIETIVCIGWVVTVFEAISAKWIDFKKEKKRTF